MSRKLLTLGFAALVLAATFSVGSSASAPGGGNRCHPGVAFENSEVRIWWQSKKPLLHVTDKNTSSGRGQYDYFSRDLVELDASGEPVRHMSLARAHPDASECSVTETAEFVNLTLTFTDQVKSIAGGPVGEAEVTFAYHFNKSAYGAKFDLVVNAWPWASDAEDHTFAYDFRMQASNLRLEPAENGVGVKDANNQSQGYVEWAENATVTFDDGREEEANVAASWEGDAHRLDIRLAFEDVDGGYVGLYYDPWMGIGDYLIVANRLVGLAPVEQLLPSQAGRVARSLL